MNRGILKNLLTTPSVRGYEEAIQKEALIYGKSFSHPQLTAPSSNAVSVVNPNTRHKVPLRWEAGRILKTVSGC